MRKVLVEFVLFLIGLGMFNRFLVEEFVGTEILFEGLFSVDP
jgi:hypothetical protein